MSDPFLPGYYSAKGIGDSNKERYEHFQSQLDKWKLLRAPSSCPKRLRAVFMAKAKEALVQARDFYKGKIDESDTAR